MESESGHRDETAVAHRAEWLLTGRDFYGSFLSPPCWVAAKLMQVTVSNSHDKNADM